MTYVTDTSPVRALHCLGRVDLLGDLYELVFVPPAVVGELGRATRTSPAIDVIQFPWLRIEAPRDLSRVKHAWPDLDAGETEAIALALELNATLLLIDERKGDRCARRLGLTTIGILGVLLEARRRSRVDAVLPLVDRLVAELDFFVSPALRREIALLADETP